MEVKQHSGIRARSIFAESSSQAKQSKHVVESNDDLEELEWSDD